MSDIFISYASEDRARAKTLARALETRGFSLWWDRNIVAGQIFDEVIEHELETAKSVIVLWSKYSIVSEWVKNEAQVAAERGTLVPAFIDSVKLPLEFRRKQTADLIGWNGDLEDTGFIALCQGVAAHIAKDISKQSPVALPNETVQNNVNVSGKGNSLIPEKTKKPGGKHDRRALPWIGTSAVIVVALIGLWVWDAFYRLQIS